ncbi:MAG: hypothetical protein JXR96_25730 [Deltaproteobacteria bacterium]|nr:hypothetical protein [Deltaproteobacteria bacterium]
MTKLPSLAIALFVLLAASAALAAGPLDDLSFDDLQLALRTGDAGGSSGGSQLSNPMPYDKKNPVLAGAFSLWPGGGQLYNGEYFVGSLWMAADLALYLGAFAYAGAFTSGENYEFKMRPEAIALLSVAVGLHMFSIYDAITEAQRQNEDVDKWSVAYDPVHEGFSVAYQARW